VVEQQAQNAVTLIERYGSFGLLVVIVLLGMGGIGWCVWYAACRLIPKVMAWLEKRDADHAAQMERRDVICKTAAETSAKAATQVGEVAKIVGELAAEVRQAQRKAP